MSRYFAEPEDYIGDFLKSDLDVYIQEHEKLYDDLLGRIRNTMLNQHLEHRDVLHRIAREIESVAPHQIFFQEYLRKRAEDDLVEKRQRFGPITELMIAVQMRVREVSGL